LYTPAQNDDRRALASAVAALNQSGLWQGTSLRIHYDLASQRLTVQFVNSDTDEVVDQIPSEEALRLSADLASNSNSP